MKFWEAREYKITYTVSLEITSVPNRLLIELSEIDRSRIDLIVVLSERLPNTVDKPHLHAPLWELAGRRR